MATPDRDTVYTTDGTTRSVYTRESSSTGWFVGIVVALALLAIGYLVFSANSNPAPTTIDTNTTVTSPVTDPATAPTPMIEAPAASTDTTATPMAPATAPATTDVAPAGGDVSPTVTAPATETTAPAAQ